MRKSDFLPINWIQYLTLTLAIATAATTIIIFHRLDDAALHRNDALRAVICRIETAVKVSPQYTIKKKIETIKFYNSLLSTIGAEPCAVSNGG